MKEHKLITWYEDLHLVKGNMSQLLSTVSFILQKTPSPVDYNNLCLALGISPKAPAANPVPAAAGGIEARVRNLVQCPQLKAALHFKRLYESGDIPALKLLALINFKSLAANSSFADFLDYEPSGSSSVITNKTKPEPTNTEPEPLPEADLVAEKNDLLPQKSIESGEYPPPLPSISDPLLLIRVFTDKSYLSCAELLPENACNQHNAKMSIRGRSIIDLVLYDLIDDALPMYDETQIFWLRSRLTSDTILAKLAVGYSMPGQSRHQISTRLSDAVKLNIFANLLASYVCALKIDGYSYLSLSSWIATLFSPALKAASDRVAQSQPYGAELALMYPTTNPDHKRLLYVQLERNPFVSRVYMDDYPLGTGTSSRSLAEAEARAASNTIENEDYMLVLRQDLCDEGALQCQPGQIKDEYQQYGSDSQDHSDQYDDASNDASDQDGDYDLASDSDGQYREERDFNDARTGRTRDLLRMVDNGTQFHLKSIGHAHEGYQDGHQDGYQDGYQDQYQDGHQDQYQDEYRNGNQYQDQYRDEYQDEYRDEYQDGYQAEYQDGYQDDYHDGVYTDHDYHSLHDRDGQQKLEKFKIGKSRTKVRPKKRVASNAQQDDEMNMRIAYDDDLLVNKRAKKNIQSATGLNPQSPTTSNPDICQSNQSVANSTGESNTSESAQEKNFTLHAQFQEFSENLSQRHQQPEPTKTGTQNVTMALNGKNLTPRVSRGPVGAHTVKQRGASDGAHMVQQRDASEDYPGALDKDMHDLRDLLKSFGYEPFNQAVQARNGYIAKAYAGNIVIGVSSHPDKKIAKRRAAAIAMRALVPEGNHLLHNGRMLLKGKSSKPYQQSAWEPPLGPTRSASRPGMSGSPVESSRSALESAPAPHTKEPLPEPSDSEPQSGWKDSPTGPSNRLSHSDVRELSEEPPTALAHPEWTRLSSEVSEPPSHSAFIEGKSINPPTEQLSQLPNGSQNQENRWHDHYRFHDMYGGQVRAHQSNEALHENEPVRSPGSILATINVPQVAKDNEKAEQTSWNRPAVESAATASSIPLTNG